MKLHRIEKKNNEKVGFSIGKPFNGASQIRRLLDYGVTHCIMNVVTVEVSDYRNPRGVTLQKSH